jgi:hypothetical protein
MKSRAGPNESLLTHHRMGGWEPLWHGGLMRRPTNGKKKMHQGSGVLCTSRRFREGSGGGRDGIPSAHRGAILRDTESRAAVEGQSWSPCS